MLQQSIPYPVGPIPDQGNLDGVLRYTLGQYFQSLADALHIVDLMPAGNVLDPIPGIDKISTKAFDFTIAAFASLSFTRRPGPNRRSGAELPRSKAP